MAATLRQPAPSAAMELRAFEILKESLSSHADLLGDPRLLLDMAEGSTSLIEAIDCLLADDLEDESLIAGIDTVLSGVNARHARIEQRRDARRAILEQAMTLLETTRIERPLATVSLVHRQPAVLIESEADLPARFFKSKPVLDRRTLKAALEAGEAVEGARLTNGALSLTIRRR